MHKFIFFWGTNFFSTYLTELSSRFQRRMPHTKMHNFMVVLACKFFCSILRATHYFVLYYDFMTKKLVILNNHLPGKNPLSNINCAMIMVCIPC